MTTPILLDGTTLEGGGQLFRLALSLSAITREPVHITDIRGKRAARSRNSEAGGIKPAHYAGAAWLAKATQANAQGLEVKSKELFFSPSGINAVKPESEPTENDATSAKEAQSARSGSVWKDKYEAGKLIRRESEIAMKTPGSVFLILQAILPYLLFSSVGPLPADPEYIDPVPLRLTIEGGTNVWHSLSHEYAQQVLFPVLHHKLGLAPITMKLHRRGWSTGSTAVGKVQFDITPVPSGRKLPAFALEERGEISEFRVSILAPDKTWREGLRSLATEQIGRRWPDADIEFPVDEFSGHRKRVYLLLVAESSNGFRLGRDWLYDEKINEEKPVKTMEKMVSKVVRDMEEEIDHGGCVDEWLQDQLVIFQALAEGSSTVQGGGPSLHTQTARWVARQIVGVEFGKQGTCEGIGYTAGSSFVGGMKVGEMVENVAQLKV